MPFFGTGANVTSLNASNISSGTVATARLGSGTPSSSNFLRGDGTWAAASGGPSGIFGQAFNSSGTFTIPAGVVAIKATIVGGGGGGGGGANNSYAVSAGGSGGAGGTAIGYFQNLTPGNTLTVTVGAGGNATASGGTSSVSSGTQSISTVSGNGGGGGAQANPAGSFNNEGAGGAGGGTSNATIGVTGQNGTPGSGAPGLSFFSSAPAVGFGQGGQGRANTSGLPGRAGIVLLEW